MGDLYFFFLGHGADMLWAEPGPHSLSFPPLIIAYVREKKGREKNNISTPGEHLYLNF